TWSLDSIFSGISRKTFGWVFIAATLLPLIGSLNAYRRANFAAAAGFAALAVTMAYVYYVALVGDGYVEIARHTVLLFSLICASFTFCVFAPALALLEKGAAVGSHT
ncbi:MAG TPA: hypothetical protein VGC24_06505, partial [Burkholderiaceae bacterium]